MAKVFLNRFGPSLQGFLCTNCLLLTYCRSRLQVRPIQWLLNSALQTVLQSQMIAMLTTLLLLIGLKPAKACLAATSQANATRNQCAGTGSTNLRETETAHGAHTQGGGAARLPKLQLANLTLIQEKRKALKNLLSCDPSLNTPGHHQFHQPSQVCDIGSGL